MRKYLKTIFACCLMVTFKAQAQELTFISPIVEKGVRQHLGFTDDEQIGFQQLDTITSLDLSRRGVTDIRDLVLMPKLRTLDLNDNMVEDLQPLSLLGELEWVDLSYNNLKGINDLFYSTAKNLTINVAFNHIRDFSLFASMSSCSFTFEGVGLQVNENAPYMDVCQFFTYIDNEEKPIVSYRGYTNMAAAANLKYGASNVSAQLDGNTYQVAVTENLDEVTLVTLSNGEQSETTYVVPTAKYAAGAGKTITMETGLPDDYYLSSVYASQGTVEIDGNKLKYTAPAKAVSDIVVFSYYQGATLKGFSRYYVNMGTKGDVNISGVVDVQDATLAVNYILGKVTDEDAFDFLAADMNGDNQVDVFDVTAIINAIFNESGSLSAARSLARQEGDLEKVRLTASENGLLIGIDRANRFTSFQFDVEVPQGTDLLDVTWNGNSKHSLQFARIGENRYRVVALSMSSAPLPASDEALLCLQLSGIPDGNVWVGNVLFVTPEGKALRLNGDTMNMTTGIQGISHTQGEQIYDISGRQLDKKREQLGKGVYIINNKKVVIK